MYFPFVVGQVSYVLEQLWNNSGRILFGIFLKNVYLEARKGDGGCNSHGSEREWLQG
jgi:hypothetical protein